MEMMAKVALKKKKKRRSYVTGICNAAVCDMAASRDTMNVKTSDSKHQWD